MATQVTKIDKAKAQIVLDHPFFASILLKRKLTETNDVKTLAVDARGNIYYNEKFVESLTVPQLVWGLCHEIGHVIGQHALRKKHRDHSKWNYAGDAWINDMLDDANVGQRVDGVAPGFPPERQHQAGQRRSDKAGSLVHHRLQGNGIGQSFSALYQFQQKRLPGGCFNGRHHPHEQR